MRILIGYDGLYVWHFTANAIFTIQYSISYAYYRHEVIDFFLMHELMNESLFTKKVWEDAKHFREVSEIYNPKIKKLHSDAYFSENQLAILYEPRGLLRSQIHISVAMDKPRG